MKLPVWSLGLFLFSSTLHAEEGKTSGSIVDYLQTKVSSPMNHYNFIDELGSHELLYSDELVFKNVPSEWKDEVRNLFLVKISPATEVQPLKGAQSTYQSIEQILMNDIIKAGWQNGKWVKSGIESEFMVGHPFLTSDGNRLFFISDMKGSIGGTDIYLSEKINNQWSEPVSLKTFTNTKENEYFPSIEGNTLRYISKGKVTFIEVSEFIRYVSKLPYEQPKINALKTVSVTPVSASKPNLTKSVDGLSFKIQLGLFRAPDWSVLNSKFSKYGTMESNMADGITIVRLGVFDNLDFVDSILEEIRKEPGFSSAFIVSFNKGRIISTDDARKISEQSKVLSQQ